MDKKGLFLAAAAVVAMASGCSSSHKSAGSPPSTTLPSSVTTVTTAPPVSTTSVPGSSTTTIAVSTTVPSGPQPCATANLAGSLGSPSGAAGSVYYSLVLANTGPATCTLSGYPGVSLVTSESGGQIGAAATHTSGTVATVTLAHGQSASANLGITVASNYGSSCDITAAAGLRVYPPGQTTALFIPHSDNGCANSADVLLHVGPVAAG